MIIFHLLIVFIPLIVSWLAYANSESKYFSQSHLSTTRKVKIKSHLRHFVLCSAVNPFTAKSQRIYLVIWRSEWRRNVYNFNCSRLIWWSISINRKFDRSIPTMTLSTRQSCPMIYYVIIQCQFLLFHFGESSDSTFYMASHLRSARQKCTGHVLWVNGDESSAAKWTINNNESITLHTSYRHHYPRSILRWRCVFSVSHHHHRRRCHCHLPMWYAMAADSAINWVFKCAGQQPCAGAICFIGDNQSSSRKLNTPSPRATTDRVQFGLCNSMPFENWASHREKWMNWINIVISFCLPIESWSHVRLFACALRTAIC